MANFDPASQIRVLVLEEGAEATPVSFSIEFVDIKTKSTPQEIQWEAISYRWDSYGELRNVQVNDGMLQIHDNVFRMLHDLRLPGQKRRLWIDAICINQTDESEKAEQVQLMRYIYEKAHQVVIWLDCEWHKNTAAAVASACYWTDRKCKLSDTLPTDRTLQQVFAAENPDIPWSSDFHEIVKYAWFKRIWVIQEAAFAKSLLVHIHNNTIPWDEFASTALKFMSLAPAFEAIHKDPVECYEICQEKNFAGETLRGLEMVHLILNLRSWVQFTSVSIPPSEMALLCRGRQATDGRDMIYGIRGFFGLEESLGGDISFPVDYTLTSAELNKRFVCWCIQQEGNLDILAQTRNERGWNSGKPSWIANWDSHDRKNFEMTPTIPLLQKLNNPKQPYYVEAPVCRREGDTLVVRGFIFDEISEHEFVGSGLRKESLRKDENSKDYYLRLWRAFIPKKNTATNSLFFGEEQPTVSTLKKLYDHTCERDQFTSHLWRDGPHTNQRVRQANPEFRGHFMTKRGCLIAMFPVFFRERQPVKVCYLLGGRGLFILVPTPVSPEEVQDRTGPQLYGLGCGDCFINGFEDGKGYSICRSLGLQEEDIHIV